MTPGLKPQTTAHASADERTHGFVLIELIVVMAIMLIMFVMYFGRGPVNTQKPKQAICQKNFATIYDALQIYATDNNDAYPSIRGAKNSEAPLSLMVPRYTSRSDVFICPGSKDRQLKSGESFQDRKISYAYCMGLHKTAGQDQWLMADELRDTKPHREGEIIFSPDGKEPGRNHDRWGGVIMFADGHTEISPAKAKFPIARPPKTTILNPTP